MYPGAKRIVLHNFFGKHVIEEKPTLATMRSIHASNLQSILNVQRGREDYISAYGGNTLLKLGGKVDFSHNLNQHSSLKDPADHVLFRVG